jgi:site-specific DNA recombinase
LEAKLAEVAGNKKRIERIEPLLEKAIPTFTQLESIYCKSDTYSNMELIGSMQPQKFTFEELQHRTA